MPLLMLSNMMPFDELGWINNRYRISLSFTAHQHVFAFPILWNIFEREKCNNNFSPQSFYHFLLNKDLSTLMDDTDSILLFYKNRYLNNGIFNIAFKTLNMRRPSDMPDLVEDVLQGNKFDILSKVLCMVIIISRFRHNLFHGLKGISEIVNQDKLFEMNNNYLIKLIETI